MKKILFAFGVSIVAAAASIAAASGAWLFWDVWKASDIEAFRALLGAFAGAFFAYIFVRLGDGMKRIYDRKEKHHNALVRLQHYFNDCLNLTGDNLFIADDFLRVFEEAKLQAGDRPIYMNKFHQYPIDRELVIELTNLDFANEVYALNVGLRKLNNSLATLDRAYSQIRDAFIAKNIDIQIYLVNVRKSRSRYPEVCEFLRQTKQDLIQLLATANLLSNDAPFLVCVIRGLIKSRY